MVVVLLLELFIVFFSLNLIFVVVVVTIDPSLSSCGVEPSLTSYSGLCHCEVGGQPKRR